MPQAISIGEILIDFVSEQTNVNLSHSKSFRKAAGGAPANVAVGLSKLGVTSGFIGKVGNDAFGYFLKDSLQREGVDVSGCIVDEKYRTTIGFASVQSDGHRDFLFYRNPGADMMLSPSEIEPKGITDADVFHFGTVGLAFQPSRDAHLYALDIAKKNNLLICYDPNIRLGLWNDPQEAQEWTQRMVEYADVVKASEEEWELLTGTADLERGAKTLITRGAQIVVVTRGTKGCYYYSAKTKGYVPGFNVEPVDCLGAGDGFMAALIERILTLNLLGLNGDELDHEMFHALRFANAAGALTCTNRGVIPSLPTLEQVNQIINLVE